MKIFLDGISVFIGNWQLIMGMLVFASVIAIPFLPGIDSDFLGGSRRRSKPASVTMGIFLALFIIFSFLVRLAYVSRVLFPSYFDSAHHYTITKNIMTNDPSWIFDSIYTGYYHMGFHIIAAFFASVFHSEISTVMLIFGQIILTVIPIPFFFIIRYITRSNWAGMYAAILSSFGWYMPAHAVDWGKYPALLSLHLIMLVLGGCYLFLYNKDKVQTGKRIFTFVILGISVLFTTFVHSRSLIVFGVVAVAWVISIWWERRSRSHSYWIFLVLIVSLIFEVIIIQRSEILLLLFDPYLNKGILVTSLVVLLVVFAYKEQPQLTFISLMTICLLLLSLFISVKGLLPGRDYLTLMDRPYVEMILYMPLSMLGGLGSAGLEKRVKSSYQRYVILAGIGLVLVYAFVKHEFYPSECCVIVGNDDVAAMAWMADQVPVEARIGIASTQLKVLVEDVAEGDVGADAGIWITPLTERRTFLLPNNSEFDQPKMLDFLCAKRIGYLFVGELGQAFDVGRLDLRPAWYRPLLSMPRTRVYEVIGCN